MFEAVKKYFFRKRLLRTASKEDTKTEETEYIKSLAKVEIFEFRRDVVQFLYRNLEYSNTTAECFTKGDLVSAFMLFFFMGIVDGFLEKREETPSDKNSKSFLYTMIFISESQKVDFFAIRENLINTKYSFEEEYPNSISLVRQLGQFSWENRFDESAELNFDMASTLFARSIENGDTIPENHT